VGKAAVLSGKTNGATPADIVSVAALAPKRVTMRKSTNIIQLVVLAQLILMSCGQTPEERIRAHLPHFNTLKEAVDWCESNLRYQNDDPWDPAPNLEAVFKDKHGDCKMLAGAVYGVLKSVGQESKIVTI